MNDSILGVDMAAPGSDMTVKVTKDADGKIVSVERLEAPLEPAPPVGTNAAKVAEAPAIPATATDMAKIMARMMPPEMELVGINGKPLAQSAEPAAINGEATISTQSTRVRLPPGIDIHKKLMVNTNTCKGKMGRRAARMQLEGARKEQMRLLKEERRNGG